MVSLVRIRLVPQGYYARSWQLSVLLTLANIHEESYGSPVRCGEGYILLEGSEDDVCQSLSTTLRVIVDDTVALSKTLKLAAPKLGKNDRQVLRKAGIGLSGDETYLEAFTRLALSMIDELERGGCKKHLVDLGRITRRGRKYHLGEKADYSPLQPLKLEKHEYSKDYMDFTGVKGDLKTSKIWLAMLTSGWMRTYIGMAGGYLTFSLPPDHLFDALICDPIHRRALEELLGREPLGVKGYYKMPAKVRGSSNPPEAFRMLLAMETVEQVKSPAVASLPPYRIVRVGFDGRTARLIEDSIIDVSQLLQPLARLKAIEVASGVRVLSHLRRLAECATRAYHRIYPRECEALFGGPGDPVTMIKLLHQALIGSLRAEKAVYMVSRLSPEPARGFTPPFRRSDVVSSLLEALM